MSRRRGPSHSIIVISRYAYAVIFPPDAHSCRLQSAPSRIHMNLCACACVCVCMCVRMCVYVWRVCESAIACVMADGAHKTMDGNDDDDRNWPRYPCTYVRDLHRQGHSPGTYCTNESPQHPLYRSPMYHMYTMYKPYVRSRIYTRVL